MQNLKYFVCLFNKVILFLNIFYDLAYLFLFILWLSKSIQQYLFKMLPFPGNYYQFNQQSLVQLYSEVQRLKNKNQNLQRAFNQSQMQIRKLQLINQSLHTKTRVKIQNQEEHQHLNVQPKFRSRRRRRNDNVDGLFECPYDNCSRTYGTSLALNLHIKLKHNGGSKKQRQKAAKKIIQCEEKGEQAPKYFINFPPNYIQNYKLMMKAKKSF